MTRILRLVGLLLLGLVAGGVMVIAIVMGVLPVPFGPAAEARAAEEAKKPPVTVMYPTRERVVNLADPASSRYLKAQITLEFVDSKLKDPPKGEEVKKQQDEFMKEMVAHAALIEDRINMVLSSKSASELLSPKGKQELKDELITELNHALHDREHVANVYFVSFIIQ